ncbi:hypothetical protein [Flavobacterium celericrescens]|uniref:Uncharacterized protein n=1 Tax=Flavobacterium celericrescens TaxID=2709780 RepID=A0ABX0IBK0_9FLAO|nr:hypothetical protein [Flavobacterium celericrescens]
MLVKPVIPVLEYIVNYDYISKELCINKDKPALKCNGKCHLMKQLAKVSDDEKPISNDKKDNSKQEVEILFYQEVSRLIFFSDFCFINKFTNSFYLNLYCLDATDSIFHPPTFLV